MTDKTYPIKLAMQFFPQGWHFTPHNPYKSLTFYKDIVLSTESILIKLIQNHNDASKIIYHSLYIKKIIAMSQWGSHPLELQELPGHESHFYYYDYMESWMNIFLY